MSDPRTRPDPVVHPESAEETRTSVLDSETPKLAEPPNEIELDLAIQSAAARLLSFALARAGEEEILED